MMLFIISLENIYVRIMVVKPEDGYNMLQYLGIVQLSKTEH